MRELFEETDLRGMHLANRLVRSATWEGLAAPDGACTGRLITLVERLAEGGVGLIISGHAYVSREGQAGPWQMGIHDDALLPGLQEMTGAVHRRGGRIAAQLAHAGVHAASRLSGLLALGPSRPSPVPAGGADGCREMTAADIDQVVQAFGEAAARARHVGFDAVQIHAAHGYLLGQFLSPLMNRRADGFGGSRASRSRILLEVLRSVRARVGRDYPVLIKLNSEDFTEGGFSVDDMLDVSALLEQEGIDAIELSGGTINDSSRYSAVRPGAVPREREAYYRDAARRFKERIGVPLILVGGIRSPDVAEQLVSAGIADYVALSRPLICEPDLPRRWREGDARPSACLSDNRCFGPAVAGEGLRCVLNERRKMPPEQR